MRAFRFIIPVMLIVGVFSWMMLNKSHQDVPETSRVWITIGAVIVSGIISYFLFPKDEGKRS
ncbi:histidine kinase [Sporosarcina sp. FSL K6-1522]|uniref:histidine kinase n=1 Tax=Sporosarcina sp. FSL K6-1522 TaxID=2921554 RepID=UPI00315ADA7F